LLSPVDPAAIRRVIQATGFAGYFKVMSLRDQLTEPSSEFWGELARAGHNYLL
jgi:hypothetical protein